MVCEFFLLKIVISMFVLVIFFLLFDVDWMCMIVCWIICWKLSVGWVLILLVFGMVGVLLWMKLCRFWCRFLMLVVYVCNILVVVGLFSRVSSRCLIVMNLWCVWCVFMNVMCRLIFNFWVIMFFLLCIVVDVLFVVYG